MDDKIKIFDARVNVQDIAVSNLQTLVSHSENIYVIQCYFDETWEGYTKKAVFQSKTRTINVIMASDEVQVPHEMIEDIETGFRMGVYGVKGTAIKPTVYTKILVGKHRQAFRRIRRRGRAGRESCSLVLLLDERS